MSTGVTSDSALRKQRQREPPAQHTAVNANDLYSLPKHYGDDAESDCVLNVG